MPIYLQLKVLHIMGTTKWERTQIFKHLYDEHIVSGLVNFLLCQDNSKFNRFHEIEKKERNLFKCLVVLALEG